jgi:hypothetical protein
MTFSEMSTRGTNAANEDALNRIAATEPVLTGIERASIALGLAEGELGHAGPPFQRCEDIPHVVLNSLAGAALHEGWAGSLDEARRRLIRGEIRLRPNHALGTVSPMTGVVRPSQMVMRVENVAGTGVTYATLAESGRRVLRFGFYDDAISAGLDWLDAVLGPAIARALPRTGLPLLPLISEGVSLGDDVHQRNVGGMYAFVRSLVEIDHSLQTWLLGNPQHVLNYAMAAAKLALDQARSIALSSIVTAISRNGHVCGIQLAGTGERWFVAQATIPDGAFFQPYMRRDAQADLGDSAIMEAYGLGGAIAHASPELARIMGQNWSEAVAAGRSARRSFLRAHPLIKPALAEPAGVGLGLDALRVVEEGEPVRIHTGVSHRDGQSGWIGIGVAYAPIACFEAGVAGLIAEHAPGTTGGRAGHGIV